MTLNLLMQPGIAHPYLYECVWYYIQVVHGSHGLSPAGPVRDFALRNHSAFPGGVFWLNGGSEFLNGALELVNAVSPTIVFLLYLAKDQRKHYICVHRHYKSQ